MIPGTLLYVYLGSIAQDLTALFSGELGQSPVGNSLMYVGLGATLILTVLITRFASGALEQQLESQPEGVAPAPENPRRSMNERLIIWVRVDQVSRGLLAPSNYVNPRPQERYHLVVVGAGPAGLISAIGAAELGAKVA